MTKVVLCPDGYLSLSTRAMLELIRRGSAGIRATDTTGWDEEHREKYGCEYWNKQSDWRSIPGEPEYQHHHFYKSKLRRGFIHYDFYGRRDDPILVQLVEELGQSVVAEGHRTPLIVDIPDDVDWDIQTCQDRAPAEWIAEKHRVWEVNSEGDGVYEEIVP